jgi:MoaA/NifB/PqqE/SkfB family radical SAM enzyme
MKLVNTAWGILSSKIRKSPFYVRYQITYRCNYRCKMCGQDHTGGKELKLNQIEVTAKRLQGLGSRHMVITGGEPFMRRDLPQIIKIFKEHGFSIRIQTNGGKQVSEDFFVRCVDAGLQDVSVSLDTLNTDLQDDICQGRDVVQNAIRTLMLARKYLPNSISLANIVASAYNFLELPDLVRYFHNIGVYSYITPVMISPSQLASPEYLFRSSHEGFVQKDHPHEYDQVIDDLIYLRKNGYGLTNSTRHLQDYKEYLGTGISTWRCEAGSLGLDVLPDGAVTICKEKPPFGNILDDRFKEIYYSKIFANESDQVISACSGCFYGEYREPQYAIRHADVLAEWILDYYRVYRSGMQFNKDVEPSANILAHEQAFVDQKK